MPSAEAHPPSSESGTGSAAAGRRPSTLQPRPGTPSRSNGEGLNRSTPARATRAASAARARSAIRSAIARASRVRASTSRATRSWEQPQTESWAAFQSRRVHARSSSSAGQGNPGTRAARGSA